jgi:hypothetical protein
MDMKRHPVADALALRLTAAANQPPAVVGLPLTPMPEAVAPAPPSPETKQVASAAVPERKQRKSRKAERLAEEDQGDTMALSLHPRRELYKRYVLAASDRMRETGRTTSPQQIMLEVLERGL